MNVKILSLYADSVSHSNYSDYDVMIDCDVHDKAMLLLDKHVKSDI